MTTTVLAGAMLGLLGVGLVAWRPMLGCALMALAIPLTAGIGRDTIIPLLRPSEAITLAVLAGVILHRLLFARPLHFTGLDLVVLAFALGSLLIPTVVLLLTRVGGGLDTWRTVVSPIQYLAVYAVFSRCVTSRRSARWLLNLMLLASVVVGVVAVVELLDDSVRTALASYYETPALPSWDPVYRPTSLLGHFSAVGAFALISCTLALALAAARVPGFNGVWLSLVMLVNILSLLVSETWAPLVALPFVFGLIFLYSRRVPPHAWWVLGVLVVSVILLWPFLSGRIDQQQLVASNGLALPETMQWRIRYWLEFFLPAASDNLAWGSGTTIPSMVPERISSYVDNEYLYAVFRAGLPGVALLLGMFIGIGWVAWRERLAAEPETRALAAACLAAVIALALMGATSEYLSFGAVSQLFWMQVGLLAAQRMRPPKVDAVPASRVNLVPRLAHV